MTDTLHPVMKRLGWKVNDEFDGRNHRFYKYIGDSGGVVLKTVSENSPEWENDNALAELVAYKDAEIERLKSQLVAAKSGAHLKVCHQEIERLRNERNRLQSQNEALRDMIRT